MMTDLNQLTDILLYSVNYLVLAPTIIIGFMSIDRKIFGQAILLLLTMIIFNHFLKDIFQVPLKAHLNKNGYAFPSGHMSSAVIFYGWLAIKFKHNLLRIGFLALIALTGFSLIYQNYHNIIDIIGSVIFAGSLLAITMLLERTKSVGDHPFLLGYIFIFCSSLMLWYLHYESDIESFILMVFISLIGFTISWSYLAASLKGRSSPLAVIISCLSAIGMYYLLLMINLSNYIPYDLEWLAIIIISTGLPIATNITSNIKSHS